MSNELTKMNDISVIVGTEIDKQIATARHYPREVVSCIKDAISLATMSDEVAQSCIYALPRRGKDSKEIKGPSIRLAEIIASCFGNIHAASRIISNDGTFITAEGVAWDLEKNLRMGSEVKRSIKTKEGKTYSVDMQTVTGNAAAAIALRNAIFKVVPKAFVDMVYSAAVSHCVGDQKTFPTKRALVFDKLAKMGIEKETILSYYQTTTIEEITPEILESIIGIGSQIKEGTLSVDEAFVVKKEYEEERDINADLGLNKTQTTDEFIKALG